MTEAEVKLMKALNSPLKDIDFDKTKFSDVLQYLQDKTGQSIIIPKAILEEVGVTYETGVTLKADGVTMRTILKKILGDLNLTYIVKDGTIQVTTPERQADHDDAQPTMWATSPKSRTFDLAPLCSRSPWPRLLVKSWS